ncbi:MAG TPA: glycosyltransferase family 4 protein [Bdellovibrionales bacterium]|nr:glycosyltransferase family 4 protein [Bdellovibrionales bacterium]
MRIAIATPHRRVAGGAESYLRVLMPRLASLGHELLFCWEHDGLGSNERALDEAFGVRGHSLTAMEPLGRIASFKPDVVYTHGLSDSALEGELARSYPTVLYAHNFFATCVSGTKRWKDHPGEPCSRVLSFRCLAAYLPHGCGGRNLLKAAVLYRQAARANRNLGRFRRVLVASRFMETEYGRHTATPVHVLPYPLTIEVPQSAPKAPPVGRAEILFLSRLTPLKGGVELVRAVHEAQRHGPFKLRLHVAGGGPDREAIELAARELGVDAVLHGWVTAENRERLLREAHLLAMPSTWPEPFGLSGVEAGAFGVPSIAYRFGGIPDWLEPGVNGELAEAGANGTSNLAAALNKVLADPGAYARYSQGARNAAARYGTEAHIERLLKHFEEVL